MCTSPATTAYIALGANLGDRAANLRQALALLGSGDVRVTAASDFMKNPAVGGPEDSPEFLNAAAEIHTTLGARDLLQRLLEVERKMGRVRREKWGPRPIDLDLLLFGDQIVREPELTLPHPRMHERRFVLQPLAQIAPDVVHPTMGKSVAQLLRGLEP